MSEFDSSPLFELIKNLSGPEKRYFKLFASRHIIGEANVYVSLFNILDRQKTYDEKKIFISEKKIKKSQFHNIKKYLYDIILKSLNSFHINDSNETRLRHMVHQVKILYEKGLYEQAKKIIRKAKKIAIIHEHYTIHIDLLLWERAIYNNTSGLKKIEHHLIAVSKEEKNLIENLKLLNEVKAAQDIIFSISTQGKNRIQKEKMKKQWPLLKSILKKGESGKFTFDMWRFVFNACSLFYRAMDDTEKTYYYNKKMVELHEGHPERHMHAIDRYLTALHNHLIACEEFKRDEIPMILEKLKKINDTHPQVKRSILLQSKIFQMSAMSQMDLVISNGDFKSGVILIHKEIENRLEKYENVMPHVFKWHLYYSIADIYFGAGKFIEAHTRLNKLLNDPAADRKQDVATAARILNLMTHIELNNTDYLQYIFKSTSRFLNTKMGISKVEKHVLHQFKKIIQSTSADNTQQYFIDLKKQLIPLQNNINEKSIFSFIDIISWVESKIEKRSFAEIVKEKARK